MSGLRTPLIALALLACPLLSRAQVSLGLYSSFKGFGIELTSEAKSGGFDSFLIYADTYGMGSGRTGKPGARALYTRNFYLAKITEGVYFYTGAGAGAGYVRDFEKGLFTLEGKGLENPYGVCVTAVGKAGMVVLRGDVRINVDIVAEVGLHFRHNEEKGGIESKLYGLGILNTFLPSVSVSCPLGSNWKKPQTQKEYKPRLLKFGAEWGYCPSVWEYYNYQYKDSGIGYWQYDISESGKFTNGGAVLVNFGVNIASNHTLEIFSGFQNGLKRNSIIPLGLRYCYFPFGTLARGVYPYADGGVDFTPFLDDKFSGGFATLGCGYKYPLGIRNLALNLRLGLQGRFRNPILKDSDGRQIPDKQVKKSELIILSPQLMIGLDF